MTFAEAMQILAALEKHGVSYVLVGSMAMAAHGLIRATRDMDIFVDPEAANIARLRAALLDVFADPDIHSITAEDLGGDYPAIQYIPRDRDYWIDILARLGDAFGFSDLEHDAVRVGEVTVRVATPRMLYRMKRDTVRPQDRVDAQLLKQRFQIEDE